MKGRQEAEMKDRTYFEIRLESLGGLGANLCGKCSASPGLNIWD